jgi:hypothetical protein
MPKRRQLGCWTWEAPQMKQRSSRNVKVTALITGTVAAVLLWGFGVEYVLHSYFFILPPQNSTQMIK